MPRVFKVIASIFYNYEGGALKLLRENRDGLTVNDVADGLNCGYDDAYRALVKLEEQGKVRRDIGATPAYSDTGVGRPQDVWYASGK